MSIARRGFLGVLAASPLGARVAVEEAKARMLTGASAVSGGAAGYGDQASQAMANKSMDFFNFKDWLGQIGEAQIRREAKRIRGFDADIIEMRLPLATKARMQEERNYARELEDRRGWFEERFSREGVVKWWG